MKFFDRLKNSLKTTEKASSSVASEKPQIDPDSAEGLWFSLCDNPNLEDKIPLLISVCRIKGGPAAVYAALEELSHTEGSWLPQAYLGRIALEQNDIEQAVSWYQSILTAEAPENYALFMISADLGRCGFAALMPELLSPVYDADKYDIHIGLNLLQSYRDIHDPESGLALLEEIRRHDQPEIHEYLEGFKESFLQQRREGSHRSARADGTGGADGSGNPDGTDDPAIILLPDSADPDSDPSNLPRAIQVDVPVWFRDLDGIEDLLPRTETRKRVGVYMYADTSAQGTPIPHRDDAVHPSDLAVSLPLFIGERLLFTTHYAPIALYPVSRENGPKLESLEPDVQSLFALCTREALDFVITGTVFHDGSVYRIRSWILDKAKQNARIVAKDLPSASFGETFNKMINEIMLLFYDKRFVKPAGRSGFPYTLPDTELVPVQLQALSYLLSQYLVRNNICDSAILPDDKKMLDAYACLAGTDTKNQMYLMMLLYGMKNVRRSGSMMYLNYRQLLYENADQNRYSPCVKAAISELNALFQEK